MKEILTVTLREDATWEYRWLPPLQDNQVPGLLRQMADQIEQGRLKTVFEIL